MSIAIIFGSLTGNTETAAHMIKDELGDHVTYCADVADINPEDLLPYDVLLLGWSRQTKKDAHGGKQKSDDRVSRRSHDS